MTNKSKGIIFIIISALAAGAWPIIFRTTVPHGADPMSAAAIRAYTATIVYLVFIVPNFTKFIIKKKDIPFFVLYGFITITLLYVTYITAIGNLTSAMAVILLYTAPSFVIIGSRIFYKEPITVPKIISLVTTFIGCILVVGLFQLDTIHISMLGVAMGLIAGVSYASVTLLGRHALTHYSSEVVSMIPSIVGAMIFLLIQPPWDIVIDSPTLVWGYLAIGILGGVVPRLGLVKGLSLGVEGGDANVISTIEVIVGSLGGIIFMGDLVTPLQICGMILVMAGSAIPVYLSKKPHHISEASSGNSKINDINDNI